MPGCRSPAWLWISEDEMQDTRTVRDKSVQISLPAGAAQIAADAALGAGKILLDRFADERHIEYKGDVDLVTDADHAAEALILDLILKTFPDHRFVGEEGVHRSGASVADDGGFTWLVDPLDGTTNYAHRYPHFAVSIALAFANSIVLGVVFDPMLDELFVGQRGAGFTINGKPATVSPTDNLMRSLLGTGFSYDLEGRDENMRLWERFMPRCQGVRRDGSAALNMCYVAAGRLDGFWERPINSWDIAAGAVMVEEAGGTISGYNGAFDPFSGEVVASNGLIHQAMLEVIRE